MNKLKLLALGSLLVSGVATANPACNGFEIKIKNNLTDDLLISSIKLDGADITPVGFDKLNGKTETTFTVNNSNKDIPMYGKFVFHTMSLPVKEINIEYTLENKGLVCENNTIDTPSDYPVDKSRAVNQVIYAINQ